MQALRFYASVIGLTVLLSACAGTETVPGETAGADGQPLPGQNSSLGGDLAGSTEAIGLGDASGLNQAELAERDRLIQAEQAASLREVRTFYFDYDQSTLREEYHMPLQAHASFLLENPDRRIVLNGYTDERGTKEYNLALGERRAQSVQRFLALSGAPGERIEVVSFGEEFPANSAQTEEAFAQNRRVVLEYR